MADPKDETELSIQWTKKTKAFVKGVNDFVERGLRDGWENAGSEPEEDGSRAALAVAVLDAVRRANEADNVNGLRQRFPPAHAPFVAMLDDVAQSVGPVLFLEDGAVVARLGAPYEEGSVVIVRGDDVETLDGIQMFGRSHDRAVFAYVTAEGFKTTQGWDGRVIARFQRPTGNKGFPEDLVEQAGDWDPIVETLIPFNDGKRLVVVGPGGVFLLTESSASRLFPRPESIRELASWMLEDNPDEPVDVRMDMVHAALSPDEKYVVVGAQDSNHLVLFADDGHLVANIGSVGEYPHHAAFSADGSVVAFNACHFYSGMTAGIRVEELKEGLETEPYECEPPLFVIEDGARVYVSASDAEGFILGDAYGYLRAVSKEGAARWQHFFGSTVSGVDVSADGTKLVVGTYAGFLCFVDLDTGEKDPFAIGTGTHRETRRWLFWRGEKRPLAW
mgnify:CR=1 FL=1